MEKNIVELLTELRDFILEKYPKKLSTIDGQLVGLCWCTSRLSHGVGNKHISHDEYWILKGYIIGNMPIKHNSTWGWQPGSVKPRLNWLNKRIEIETKKLNDERNRG